VKDIENFLDKVDLVLVMTVEPGFGGQSFMENCLDKVREIKNIAEKRNLDFHIQVDGGVNAQTAKLCTAAGVDVLVAGSYVYNAGDTRAAIDSLR
jgi:ribulose-phosphate 3-epimerase